MMVGMLVIFKQ